MRDPLPPLDALELVEGPRHRLPAPPAEVLELWGLPAVVEDTPATHGLGWYLRPADPAATILEP